MLKPRRPRLQCAKIMPLPSRLGDRARLHLKKKKKKERKKERKNKCCQEQKKNRVIIEGSAPPK